MPSLSEVCYVSFIFVVWKAAVDKIFLLGYSLNFTKPQALCYSDA